MADSAPSKAASKGGDPQGYFQLTRDPLASFILVLPLLVIYQVGLLMSHGQLINGADVISVVLINRWGGNGLLAFTGVLLLVGIVGAFVLRHKGRFQPKIIVPVLIESTIYAVLLGFMITYVIGQFMSGAWIPNASGDALEGMGTTARILLAIGAGVNEEFVFRLGMFGGLLWVGQRLLPEKKGATVAGAVLISSLLFSLAHYLGPEQFQVYSFFFRLLAGVFFCGLFWLRGFAVSVYTHAIYDVMVMVVLADY